MLRLIYARLNDELSGEADRRRAVEAKLVAVGSVAPIAITVMAALVTFLTSGRAGDFTRGSILALACVALYVAIQFLLATLAAVRGLGRTSYAAAQISAVINDATESEDSYLVERIGDLASRIDQHRDATNNRVSELVLAHESVKNAVFGLVLVSILLVFIALFGLQA